MFFRKYLFLVLIFISCFGFVRMAHAKSLSDLSWEQFKSISGLSEEKSINDPFAGSGVFSNDMSVEELQLYGIAYNTEHDAYALISGYMVRLGDKIAGYKVYSISKNKVKLKRLNSIYVLTLGGGL